MISPRAFFCSSVKTDPPAVGAMVSACAVRPVRSPMAPITNGESSASPPQRTAKAIRLLDDTALTAFRKMLFKVIDFISLIRIGGSSRLRLVVDDVVIFQPLR